MQANLWPWTTLLVVILACSKTKFSHKNSQAMHYFPIQLILVTLHDVQLINLSIFTHNKSRLFTKGSTLGEIT